MDCMLNEATKTAKFGISETLPEKNYLNIQKFNLA